MDFISLWITLYRSKKRRSHSPLKSGLVSSRLIILELDYEGQGGIEPLGRRSIVCLSHFCYQRYRLWIYQHCAMEQPSQLTFTLNDPQLQARYSILASLSSGPISTTVTKLKPRPINLAALAIRDEQHMTPPLTPHSIAGEADGRSPTSRSMFHNYIRAFYPFQPSTALSPSTITLPLEQGDIVLVHSVHVNGWADGTLLETGERGWLPTNYCEAYDQPPMRPLLKALTNFWDIIRGTTASTLDNAGNQDLMRGLVAGARFLLVWSLHIFLFFFFFFWFPFADF